MTAMQARSDTREPSARPAGSDTREAASTPTVRAAAVAALLAAGPGWASAFGAPNAWKDQLRTDIGAWLAVLLASAGVAAAVAAWRRPIARYGAVPMAAMPAFAVAVVGTLAAATRDTLLAAVALPLASLLCGWIAGRAARVAAASCVPEVAPAAAGIVVAWGIFGGAVTAVHVSAVAAGSGLPRAAGWTAVYAAGAGIASVLAVWRLPHDRRTNAARAVRIRTDRSAALELRGIVVRFGATTVLDGVTLAAGPGTLVALVGGNGAGKSTLLRVASGFIVPDAGRVAVRGADVTRLRPEERAETGLAFVSGARPVFPDMTVLENLRVAAFRSHRTQHAFDEATTKVLEIVPALAHRGTSKAGVLSGGEQRLLAVAQTLYQRPAVLLADELTLGLDEPARLAVLDLLRFLADDGMAVVVVDHDLPALLPRADTAVLLAGGTSSVHDDPVELLTSRADLLPATFLAR